MGYSNNSKAFRVYKMRILTIMESTNVVVNDVNDFTEFSKEEEIHSLIVEGEQVSGDKIQVTTYSSATTLESVTTSVK